MKIRMIKKASMLLLLLIVYCFVSYAQIDGMPCDESELGQWKLGSCCSRTQEGFKLEPLHPSQCINTYTMTCIPEGIQDGDYYPSPLCLGNNQYAYCDESSEGYYVKTFNTKNVYRCDPPTLRWKRSDVTEFGEDETYKIYKSPLIGQACDDAGKWNGVNSCCIQTSAQEALWTPLGPDICQFENSCLTSGKTQKLDNGDNILCLGQNMFAYCDETAEGLYAKTVSGGVYQCNPQGGWDYRDISEFDYNLDIRYGRYDADADGVLNHLDKCPLTPNDAIVDETNPDKLGCNEEPVPSETQCKSWGGEEGNLFKLNIIVLPCSWPNTEKYKFEEFTKVGADFLLETEPFSKYQRHYTVYSLWNTKENENCRSQKTIDHILNQIEISSLTCAPLKDHLENSVFIYLVPDTGTSSSSIAFGASATVLLLDYYSHQLNKPQRIEHIFLHELSHGFKFGHAAGFLKDEKNDFFFKDTEGFPEGYNDYYYPSYQPDETLALQNQLYSRPCPLWSTMGIKGNYGCYTGYISGGWTETFTRVYSPTNFPSYEDVMIYGNYYNTVHKWLVEEVLLLGYKNYMDKSYPYKCEDLLNFEARGITYGQDDVDLCLLEACTYVKQEDKEGCCSSVENPEKKDECLSKS